MVIMDVEVHQCPSGWMKYGVLLETVICLSVVTMDGETVAVHILKMLVLSAIFQVSHIANICFVDVCCIGCIEGDIRLADGTNYYEGRVEVCHKNEWGTVCDEDWDNNDGKVVCRQLGLPFVSRVRLDASFGHGTGQIWLSKLSCRGSESQLIDCIHSGFGVHSCVHSDDAGVICGCK